MVKKTKETKKEINEDIIAEDSIEKIVTSNIKEVKNVEKKTLCYLASKANYIIEIKYSGQTTYIQPFGRIKVIKEQIKLNPNDTKYLTFIKI